MWLWDKRTFKRVERSLFRHRIAKSTKNIAGTSLCTLIDISQLINRSTKYRRLPNIKARSFCTVRLVVNSIIASSWNESIRSNTTRLMRAICDSRYETRKPITAGKHCRSVAKPLIWIDKLVAHAWTEFSIELDNIFREWSMIRRTSALGNPNRSYWSLAWPSVEVWQVLPYSAQMLWIKSIVILNESCKYIKITRLHLPFSCQACRVFSSAKTLLMHNMCSE